LQVISFTSRGTNARTLLGIRAAKPHRCLSSAQKSPP
jgi:hypothetical protein